MNAIETSVPLAQAKNKLSEYVERAARGEVIIITKHGGPAARLVPFAGPTHLEAARAVEQIKALRASNPRMTAEELTAWKNMGRP